MPAYFLSSLRVNGERIILNADFLNFRQILRYPLKLIDHAGSAARSVLATVKSLRIDAEKAPVRATATGNNHDHGVVGRRKVIVANIKVSLVDLADKGQLIDVLNQRTGSVMNYFAIFPENKPVYRSQISLFPQTDGEVAYGIVILADGDGIHSFTQFKRLLRQRRGVGTHENHERGGEFFLELFGYLHIAVNARGAGIDHNELRRLIFYALNNIINGKSLCRSVNELD